MKPKIRVKGFEGEWEDIPFSEIASRTSGTASSQNLPSIEFEDINAGEGTLNKDITKKTSIKVGKYFNDGDVLFGKLRPYLKNIILASFEGTAVGDFWVLKPQKITSQLLYYLVNSKEFMRVANISSGSKMPRADWNLVSSTRFVIPNDKDEQVELGRYFRGLDGLIEATAKKIESLKRVKAASLQSMFPQEGETIPRLRFKGFSGDWVSVKLEEIGNTYSGLSGKTKEDFGKGDAKYITFLNVLTNAQINTNLLEAVNVVAGEKQNKVQKGDLLFNNSSETPEEVGMCAVMNEEIDNVYLNSFCFGFRLNNATTNPLFISYVLRSQVGRRLMSFLAQGATRYNLSKSSFCKANILLPSKVSEQEKIANFFANLDSQISLQTQRLEKLKQIKAACLDNMFV